MIEPSLHPTRFPRRRVVRTLLYEDVYVSDWELQLWHTPTFQRLYDLKQLGFADRIFPDAVHSRFNHAIGAVEVAERIIEAAQKNLRVEIEKIEQTPPGPRQQLQSPQELLRELDENADVIRVATLLHDVTHVPFGHTLEDEISAFTSRHDDPDRQAKFLNRMFLEFLDASFEAVEPAALLGPPLAALTDEEQFSLTEAKYQHLQSIESDRHDILLQGFTKFCAVLRDAQVLLLHLHNARDGGPHANLFSVRMLGDQPFVLERDHYKLDVIGNTICADLLDYARRDSLLSGLKLDFDNRIFRYFEICKVDGISRLAIRIFSNKIRLDVLSEILNVLKMRYLLSERVIFHPTKCAAGAMLGRLVSLLGISDAEEDFYDMGDREFLRVLQRRAYFLTDLTQHLLRYLKGEPPEADIAALPGITGPWEINQVRDLLVKCGIAEGGADLFDSGRSLRAGLQKFRSLAETPAGNEAKAGARAAATKVLEQRYAEATGAIRLCKGLLSRRFMKPVYQVTKQAADERELYGDKLAERFQVAAEREREERFVEDQVGLPRGSICFYCPRKETTLKEADVLVVWSRTDIQKFREIGHEAFKMWLDESNSIEGKYAAIWNMYVFVAEAFLPLAPLIQDIVRDRLRVENSQLLASYLNEDPRVNRLSKDMQEAAGVLREALARTLRMSDHPISQAAARFSELPDFYSALRQSFNEVIEEKAKERS